ncbi:MAG: UDP-N-acetylmuramate dehydrogenase [Bilifractor sp.]|jgi:UDP-N-acetylmuramate dehydrogenase
MESGQTEEKLRQIAGAENVIVNEPMRAHTTFRIGGPADYFVTPENAECLGKLIRFLETEKLPYFILGNGSNLLVSDDGYRGAVICTVAGFQELRVGESTVTAGAGQLLSKIASAAAAGNLTGMEFASGIPGTLGGALIMNAGAYGGEMKDIVREVTVMTSEGEIRRFSGDEMKFGYRTSAAKENGWIVLGATMELESGEREKIEARMNELREARTSKQPLNFPSAGSTFKRPAGHFAGKLIMDSGLAGFSVGDAQVSEKHCGFVINRGHATAEDVYILIRRIREIVYARSGVLLEPEVKFLGEFPPL